MLAARNTGKLRVASCSSRKVMVDTVEARTESVLVLAEQGGMGCALRQADA